MTLRKHMDPDRRDHFVYRAFDEKGNLLYVGCTLAPSNRLREHRNQSRWFHLATDFKMQGPYNYQKARWIEREAIDNESPRFNADEPKRARIGRLYNKVLKRWINYNVEYIHPDDLNAAVAAGMAHTNAVMGEAVDLDSRVWTADDVDFYTRVEEADRFQHRRAVDAHRSVA